ncbi:hypothetical protein MTHERMOG20_11710 [Moorella thermoacetica]|nr:hypothetical protein MOTHE_c16570 [Moorella thermoacetica]AKX97086.1 hypothetical protein MOTHA_c17400 [Moorella thermoacetica]OIQ11731.1 hypothetical protein MOOTH_13230 [Moorella thermoacetica]OIQ57495.1 hypothetical protein MOCA_10850 [Moorella thermoacetica]OIQ59645.1 hypothetical protein MTIN_22190 [Moorella thermoacetica]
MEASTTPSENMKLQAGKGLECNQTSNHHFRQNPIFGGGGHSGPEGEGNGSYEWRRGQFHSRRFIEGSRL